MTRHLNSDDIERKIEDFYDFLDSEEVNGVAFTSEYSSEELIAECSTFFEQNMELTKDKHLILDGDEYSLPWTHTWFDNQVIFSSIYVLLKDISKYYVSSDGGWLYKISDKQMKYLDSRFGAALNYRAEGDYYKVLDKFQPGRYEQLDWIVFPYVGSETTVEQFMKQYAVWENKEREIKSQLKSLATEVRGWFNEKG